MSPTLILRNLAVFGFFILLACDALAAVGTVQFAVGDVNIRDAAGKVRAARKGDAINEGDAILTGSNASAQLKMSDGGILAIRTDTELKIDTYRFAGKEDGKENALMSLLKGGFRTITGVIGRTNRDNYRITTATATIGIRGTDHEPHVILAPAPGAPQPPAPPGTYDKVNVGAAYIRSLLGQVNISQNQVGFAAPNQTPTILPVVPEFFRATPPISTVQQKPAAKPAAAAAPAPVPAAAAAPAPVPAAAAAPAPVIRATATVDTTPPAPQPSTAPIIIPIVELLRSFIPSITQPISATTCFDATGQPCSTTGVETPIETATTVDFTAQTATTTTTTTTSLGSTTEAAPPQPLTTTTQGFALTPGVIKNFDDNTRVRHEVIYTTSKLQLTDTFAARARDSISITIPTPTTLSGPIVNTNYLFDASGNLVRIFDTPYVIFDHATNVAPTTTQFSAPTPIAHAQLSFGGGGAVAAEHFEFTPAGSSTGNPIIRLGRWQGGSVNVKDLTTGDSFIDSLVSPNGGGSRSVHWLVRQGVPSFTGITGTYHYTRINDGSGNPSFATAPTDSYGNVGTLDGAQLAVDFDRMLVSAGLGITMPSGPGGSLGIQNLSARFNAVSIVSGNFNVSSVPADNPAGTDFLHVSCFGMGCAPNQTYGGRINGDFSGLNAEGADYRYTFNTNYPDAATASANGGRVDDDYIEGLVAFQRGPKIVPPSANISTLSPNPPGDAGILFGYNFLNDSFVVPRTQALGSSGGKYTVDASSNLIQAQAISFGGASVTVTGGTGATSATASNGFVHGYVVQPTLSGTDFDGAFSGRSVLDAFHWIRAPLQYPIYASAASQSPTNQSGSGVAVAYAQLGAFVTDQNNVAGSASATLSVNFNAQTVDAAVNATVPGGTFNATANGLTLDGGSAFSATKGGPVRHAFTSGTFTPVTGPAVIPDVGELTGGLGGPGLNGAGLLFLFGSGDTRASGSVVFGNPTYFDGVSTVPFSATELAPPAQILLIASGMNPDGAITRDGTGSTRLVSEKKNYRVDFAVNNANRLQTVTSDTVSPVNPEGAIIKFDGPYEFIQNFCTPSSVCNGNTNIAARYALADATGDGPTKTNLPGTPPTAKSQEFFFDAATGLSWGRWGGGVINVGDRGSPNSSGAIPVADGSGGTTNQIDLTANHWHYINGGTLSAPIVLPVSGTATYQLIGGTSPTSFTPGQSVPDVGTLNSATLSADFTARTVNVGVNVTTPGSGNWTASANNVPIIKDTTFIAEKLLSGGGNLAVTRNASSTSTAGQILGTFAGQTGSAAAIAYSLNHNGPTGVTVSGVAGFKR